MRTVWKYELEIRDGYQEVWMPPSAKVIHVAMQDMTLCMWAALDTSHAITDTRIFLVTGTGHEVPEDVSHVGTCLMHEGLLVWHVWELPLWGSIRNTLEP